MRRILTSVLNVCTEFSPVSWMLVINSLRYHRCLLRILTGVTDACDEFSAVPVLKIGF